MSRRRRREKLMLPESRLACAKIPKWGATQFSLTSLFFLIWIWAICFYLSGHSQRNDFDLDNAIFLVSMLSLRGYSHLLGKSTLKVLYAVALTAMLNFSALFEDIRRQYFDGRSIWGTHDWFRFWLMFAAIFLMFFVLDAWYCLKKFSFRTRLLCDVLPLLLWCMMISYFVGTLSSF